MNPSRKLQYGALILWALLIGVGMSVMDRYENTPGPTLHPPDRWPEGSTLRLATDRLTVVVFVHPRCPCTGATLAELSKLLARENNSIRATMVAIIPPGETRQWAYSKLLSDAALVPGLSVQTDLGGNEARRFGALTSGYTVAYMPDGTLQFSGGITEARGQAGDNYGIDALRDLAELRTTQHTTSAVFGCGLFSPRPLPVAKKQ
jgi:hypothetical protein